MVNPLEVGMLIQLLLIVAQLIVALIMYLNIREIWKDRRREFLECYSNFQLSISCLGTHDFTY